MEEKKVRCGFCKYFRVKDLGNGFCEILCDIVTLTKGETYEEICGSDKSDLLDKMEELNLITY